VPTLNWIGKEKVISHHRDVPFRVLEHKYAFSEKGESKTPVNSGNKIIHGDNLEALKSLLPEYEGKIKCIYIDPPYNTGNENWVYNDNVNHPKIQKWLETTLQAQANNTEASIGVDDLARHDKWLCMMYPRLQLLHKLLADDGAIFVSIDDNEFASLKLILDEIFGIKNYVTSLVWKRRASSQLSQNNVSVDHEYILAYFKSPHSKFFGLSKDYKNYSNPDNDPRGKWTLGDLTVGMTKDQRPNQFFDLIDPSTGKVYPPNPKRVWTYAPDTMQEKLNQNRIVFPKNEKGRPMLKRYLSDLKSDINPFSSWMNSDAYEIGLNSEGTKILQSIFETKIFDYPKPVSLIQILLSQVTSNNDIILDSFSGSGTTAHAVLNLNSQDGGHRKFILVEMEDYAETITAERVKRVIRGYGNAEGNISSFDFYELGEPLFEGDNGEYLNEKVDTEKIREYIWYSETRTGYIPPAKTIDNSYFLGKKDDTAYYFIYQKNELTTLDYESLSTIKTKSEQYVIYADNCLLPKDFMLKNNIVFKKIPRDISRF
jgi:adenine-specific DNA-methyltransferase